MKKLEKEQKSAEKLDTFQLYGELLTANSHQSKKDQQKQSSITIMNKEQRLQSLWMQEKRQLKMPNDFS